MKQDSSVEEDNVLNMVTTYSKSFSVSNDIRTSEIDKNI